MRSAVCDGVVHVSGGLSGDGCTPSGVLPDSLLTRGFADSTPG